MNKLIKPILAVLVSASGVVLLLQPHITFTESRTTAKPVKVNATFVNATGSPLCAKLYELPASQSEDKEPAGKPLFLALPQDLSSPEDGPLAYADNRFVLTGYRYRLERKNALTGSLETLPSNRFDLISWEAVPPYKVWNENGQTDSEALVGYSVETQAISKETQVNAEPVDLFVKRNSVDCLH